MPKFKLKNILSRVILGESWRERDSSDYLSAGLDSEHNTLESHSHVCTGRASDADDEEDDRNSINSFSTTATTSNLPGAGRTIDTYIYQPVGRGIERFATRLLPRRRTGTEDIGAVVIYSATAAADTDDNDDSASSINSFSTTATADNLPGTGRAVDTYIFQPMGRRIERLAMRFTITSLHPARIAQYIEAGYVDFAPSTSDIHTLNDAIEQLCDWGRDGSTVVAGMKGLVKQTQSSSITISASALAALTRVSLSYSRKEVYAYVSRIEPIFHLETLAGSLVRSHPEKKWYLFLAKLARQTTLIAVRVPLDEASSNPVLGGVVEQFSGPSPQTALDLRQRLLRVLEVHRSSGFDTLDPTIGEACAICAEAISSCIDIDTRARRGIAYMVILETVYFTFVFIQRSIHELAYHARISENKLISMVLRTLVSWTDASVYQCLIAFEHPLRIFNMNLLKANLAFRSLALVYSNTAHMLLPQSFVFTRNGILSMEVLPRRHRKAMEPVENNSLIKSLTEAAKNRTRRIIRSFNELEREVRGCPSETTSFTSLLKIRAEPFWYSLDCFGDECWAYWKSTLERALRVRVPENDLTKAFRVARRIGLERDPQSGDFGVDVYQDGRNWGHYQLYRGSRHRWGQYFRSSMDWDWDLGTCMKHLFKVEE